MIQTFKSSTYRIKQLTTNMALSGSQSYNKILMYGLMVYLAPFDRINLKNQCVFKFIII